MNGGASWTQINLPNATNEERIAIALTPSDPSKVYLLASYDSEDGNDFYALYKSTNSGSSFVKVNVITKPEMYTQSWYDWTLTVSPTNSNILFAGGVILNKSTNGGATWASASRDLNYNYVHVDHHFSGWHPITGELFVGSDGGIWKSPNYGDLWVQK